MLSSDLSNFRAEANDCRVGHVSVVHWMSSCVSERLRALGSNRTTCSSENCASITEGGLGSRLFCGRRR